MDLTKPLLFCFSLAAASRESVPYAFRIGLGSCQSILETKNFRYQKKFMAQGYAQGLVASAIGGMQLDGDIEIYVHKMVFGMTSLDCLVICFDK